MPIPEAKLSEPVIYVDADGEEHAGIVSKVWGTTGAHANIHVFRDGKNGAICKRSIPHYGVNKGKTEHWKKAG